MEDSMANIRLNTDSLRERKEWKRHKVNDGDNVFRILPPFGEASNGYPYHRWVIAWLADPNTGRRRPYASPYSFGEKTCPVSEYCKLLEKKRDEIGAQITFSLKEKGLTEEQIKAKLQEKLKVFNEVLFAIKPKAVFIYNACNKSGELGLLELKKTGHDAMKKQMMQYVKDYNQDPTSLNSDNDDSGVWFNVKKAGRGKETEYSVEKRQVKMRDQQTGRTSWVDDQEPLPDNIVENFADIGYDLTSIYKKVSYDDLKEALLANLIEIYRQNPILIVEGFEVEGLEDEQAEEVDEEPVAPVKPTPVKQAIPAKKVTTKFEMSHDDDADDEDDIPPPKVAAKPPVIAKPQKQRSVDNDAIFDYAEKLLEG
jgi:hypothetical protein